jgi:hypothetical protein
MIIMVVGVGVMPRRWRDDAGNPAETGTHD